MFKTLLYILMVGGLVGAFGWMRVQTTGHGAGALGATIARWLPGGADDAPPGARVGAEKTRELLNYVSFLESGAPIDVVDPAAVAHSALAAGSDRAALLARLHEGLTRDEVRSLLGEPHELGTNPNTWVYDVATVVFGEEGVAGWIDTTDDSSMRQVMRNALAPWGPEAYADAPTPRVPSRPAIASHPARTAGGPNGGRSYRRPLDRLFNRRSTVDRYYSGSFRKPDYLRDMFRSRGTQRTRRTSPYYDNYSY